MQNLGGVAYFGPQLSAPAPEGVKSAHINIEGAGNVAGPLFFTTGTIGDEFECDGLLEAPTVGDPIDTRSGEFYLNEYDLGVKTGCANRSLQFERTYSTLHAAAGSLSPGWVDNYDQRVIPAGEYVLVQRPRGSFLLFKDVGGDVYATRAGETHTLVKRSGGGWALVYRDQRVDLFDAQGRLEVQQDSNGNRIWMTYESYTRNGASGTRLARVDAPGGRYLWFGYDYYRPNRLIVVGDNSGRKVHFGYDDAQTFDFVDAGRLTNVTDATGAVTTYTYSPNTWLLTSATDALGHTVFTNTYNDDGRVIHQVNRTGEDLTLTYQLLSDTEGLVESSDPAQRYLLKTTVVDQLGAQRSYEYGLDGLLRSTDPLGARTRYRGYTPTRQPTEVIDPLGNSTHYAYNVQGLPTSITDALGGISTFTYDAWGNPTASADPLNHTYHFRYFRPEYDRTRRSERTNRSLSIPKPGGLEWRTQRA